MYSPNSTAWIRDKAYKRYQDILRFACREGSCAVGFHETWVANFCENKCPAGQLNVCPGQGWASYAGARRQYKINKRDNWLLRYIWQGLDEIYGPMIEASKRPCRKKVKKIGTRYAAILKERESHER
tara:strand:+ start:270 stop:650 length:381 start_codon:yes stop_codon:yes gene_type:complete